MIVGIIPARYASTRFPGKPLIDICGQTMLERVWRAATAAKTIDVVVIATDDYRIEAEALRIGARCCRTSPDLPSGTDRCFATVQELGLRPTHVVNIQGDEPLVPPTLLDELVRVSLESGADVVTPVSRIIMREELDDSAVVKVVRAASGSALYFSRSAVPFYRGAERHQWLSHQTFWRHVGLYSYTMSALAMHVSLPPSHLEQSEALEQLRLLEQGAQFHCVETGAELISVDVPADADRVRNWLGG